MGDGPTERALAVGPLDVDVDPLVVTRGIGKLVHMFLGDGDPFTDDFALSNKLRDAFKCFKNFHGVTLFQFKFSVVYYAISALLGNQSAL